MRGGKHKEVTVFLQKNMVRYKCREGRGGEGKGETNCTLTVDTEEEVGNYRWALCRYNAQGPFFERRRG